MVDQQLDLLLGHQTLTPSANVNESVGTGIALEGAECEAGSRGDFLEGVKGRHGFYTVADGHGCTFTRKGLASLVQDQFVGYFMSDTDVDLVLPWRCVDALAAKIGASEAELRRAQAHYEKVADSLLVGEDAVAAAAEVLIANARIDALVEAWELITGEPWPDDESLL